MGIDARVTFSYKKTKTELNVKQQLTRYHGMSYQGTPRNTENCSWFATNLRLVLGTLAVGMNPSDMSTLCFFMGLTNLQSFSCQHFATIELLIGKHLRNITDSWMQKALQNEIQTTKEYKKK